MWHECQKEFRGWCKAFTKTEILLTILEATLLVLCVAFLIFLVLHLIACQNKSTDAETAAPPTTAAPAPSPAPVTPTTTTPVCTAPTLKAADGRCTWEPSRKTAASVRYYADGETSRSRSPPSSAAPGAGAGAGAGASRLSPDQQTDGEDAHERYRGAAAALVRPRPPRDVAFGCTLAVVSPRWTLTAASCLEAIEEVDSLDDFVIAERFGGPTHAVDDVQVHPQYAARGAPSAPGAPSVPAAPGAPAAHDVAALRSATPLAAGALLLPTLEDYFTITLGERLTILGFGAFRSLSPIASERGLRAVAVYTVSGGMCSGAGAGGDDAWSTRHLLPAGVGGAAGGGGGGGGAARCGVGDLCAAVRWARRSPCGYCAGTPLVRARTLVGVMADARGCGAHCDPAVYTNVAAHRDWIDMLLDPD